MSYEPPTRNGAPVGLVRGLADRQTLARASNLSVPTVSKALAGLTRTKAGVPPPKPVGYLHEEAVWDLEEWLTWERVTRRNPGPEPKVRL